MEKQNHQHGWANSRQFRQPGDLIKMKKAAGRAKDKEDLKMLRKLKGRKSEIEP